MGVEEGAYRPKRAWPPLHFIVFGEPGREAVSEDVAADDANPLDARELAIGCRGHRAAHFAAPSKPRPCPSGRRVRGGRPPPPPPPPPGTPVNRGGARGLDAGAPRACLWRLGDGRDEPGVGRTASHDPSSFEIEAVHRRTI
jgi:hypothetical protein